MSEVLSALSFAGWALIIIGLALVLLPLAAKLLPSIEALERVPPILLYVYRSDSFYFVTSPTLIILGALAFLLSILR